MGNNVTIRTNKIWFKSLNDSDKLYMKNDIFFNATTTWIFFIVCILFHPHPKIFHLYGNIDADDDWLKSQVFTRRWWPWSRELYRAAPAVIRGLSFLLYSAPSLMCDETDRLLLNIVLFTGNISMVYQYQLKFNA